MFENCPFCEEKILKLTFSESLNFRAVYNIAPVLPGHSMIIPKQHITSIMEFSDEDLNEFILFSREVTKTIITVFECDGFDFSLQEKEEAGQTVDHFHFHIIPRKPGDLPKPGDWYKITQQNEQLLLDSSSRNKLSENEIHEIVNHIKQSIKNNQQ